MSDPGLPEECFFSKGKLLGGGASGIVELTDDGYAVKTPWPGKDGLDSQDDVRFEARVYERIRERLGDSPRFVKIFAFDQDQLTLTMEYMANGTLRDYLRSNAEGITRRQRYLWVRAMAEGLDLLHALDIVHCDLTPHNMLLDDKLELKIADFGCSSIDGSNSMAGTNPRFYPPRLCYKTPVSKSDDLFALGSCIYEILTGSAPFDDIPSAQACTLTRVHQFPDLVGLEFKDSIRDCWLGCAESANHVLYRLLQNM